MFGLVDSFNSLLRWKDWGVKITSRRWVAFSQEVTISVLSFLHSKHVLLSLLSAKHVFFVFLVVFVFSFCMFLTIWLYCKELVFILRIVTHFSGQFKPHSTILSKRSIGSLLQQSIVESSSASFKALKAFFLQLQRQDFNVLCHQPALMDLQGWQQLTIDY